MARQHSEEANITDCFNHLLYMTDPFVRREAPVIEEEEKKMEFEDDFIFASLIDNDEIEE